MIGPGIRERQGVLETRSVFSLTQLNSRRFLVGVVRIQSDQPWADGLMQRSLFGCTFWLEWGHGPVGR
jgi:hypothetical protein